jgi:electron transfer flavoprotein alpha subunit
MSNVVMCLFASGGFDKAALGLAGAARRLADANGGQVRAIVMGAGADAVAAEAARVADAVTVVDQAETAEYQPEICLNALTQLCREMAPSAVLFSNDTYSQEIVPRLAHRLGGAAVGDGVELRPQGGKLSVVRQVYGAKAQAVIELKRTPAVVWLRGRSFEPAEPRAAAGEITRAALALDAAVATKIIERKTDDSGQVRLEDARIIVGGGRGIGGKDLFDGQLKPLAELLGAQMGASRAACDSGWVPATWQIGLTGKKVAPELYIAVAMSGSSQHMAGVSDAKAIVGINTDAEAPIFNHCRYGIVGDFRQVVPLLREKLTALKK